MGPKIKVFPHVQLCTLARYHWRTYSLRLGWKSAKGCCWFRRKIYYVFSILFYCFQPLKHWHQIEHWIIGFFAQWFQNWKPKTTGFPWIPPSNSSKLWTESEIFLTSERDQETDRIVYEWICDSKGQEFRRAKSTLSSFSMCNYCKLESYGPPGAVVDLAIFNGGGGD